MEHWVCQPLPALPLPLLSLLKTRTLLGRLVNLAAALEKSTVEKESTECWLERGAFACGEVSDSSTLPSRGTSALTDQVSFQAFQRVTALLPLVVLLSLCSATRALPCTPPLPLKFKWRTIALIYPA